MWLPSELRSLPGFLKELIAKAISYSFKKAVQPIQNLTNLQAMLGKPGGGSRTISKTPVLYRMSLRGRHEVEDWEEDYTGEFDTAGKGKSALLAAAYRSIEAEVYNYTEEQVIGVFHDMAKFFDTIDIPVLVSKAKELEVPVLDIMLTLHQHLAPMIIQCEGFCGEPILITRSILAGCKHSVALTRLLLLTDITGLVIDHPLAPPKVYVDDTAQLTSGSATTAMTSMYNSIYDFVHVTKSL